MKWTLLGLSLLIVPSCVTQAYAQDVPGIEICTVDKTWERRTSCLQSNIDFLVKTINRMKSDQDQKLDMSRRLIEAQNTAIVALQKTVAELQGGKKSDAAAAPTKDAAPAPKDTPAQKDAPPAKPNAK